MGNVIGHLIYDGKDSRDFGVIVGSVGTRVTPQRSVESITIPGRNGTLTIDKGRFDNVNITYSAMILDNFVDRFDEFKAFLLSHKGYARLEDSFSPEYYRLARIYKSISPSVITWDAAGKFKIPFDCDPRRFLKSGEKEIVLIATSVIYNPTYYEAKPLLKVTGTGLIKIGTKEISVNQNDSYVYIDLETLNAYSGTTNMNDKVSIDDGTVLAVGENVITLANTITSVGITPRWWTI